MSQALTLYPAAGIHEPGTAEWCKDWRLHFGTEVSEVVKVQGQDHDSVPQRIKVILELLERGMSFTAWKKLTGSDGNRFPTFWFFCEEKQPYGLGVPKGEFIHLLETNGGGRAVKLLGSLTSRGKGRPKDEDKRTDLGPFNGDDKRQRAIAERAPSFIRASYQQGLISEDVAAKFGPYVSQEKPTPKQQQKQQEVEQASNELERWQRDNPPPMLEFEKPAYQKTMNKEARRILGVVVKPEPPEKAADRLAAKYSQEELRRIINRLNSLLIDGSN